MRRARREDIRAQHRDHHGAVAAARLAASSRGDHGSMRVRVALVDERYDLVAEVVHVASGRGRVDELGAAVARPRIDEHDNRRGALAVREKVVDGVRSCSARRRERFEPHVELPGHALDDVDGGIRAVRFAPGGR